MTTAFTLNQSISAAVLPMGVWVWIFQLVNVLRFVLHFLLNGRPRSSLTNTMPPRAASELSQNALRCLQRVSQASPADVPGETVAELDAAARDLLKHTLASCTPGRADHKAMLPAGAFKRVCNTVLHCSS